MAISDNSSESKSSSRRSLSKNAACRRPQLVRSSATAPCLATSNACRSDLAHLHSSTRASALLNRVASYSSTRSGDSKSGTQSPQDACHRNSSPSKRTSSSEKIGARDDLQKSMYSGKPMSRTDTALGHMLIVISKRIILQLSKLRRLSGGARKRREGRLILKRARKRIQRRWETVKALQMARHEEWLISFLES